MKNIFFIVLIMFSFFLFGNAWSENYLTYNQPDGLFSIQYPSSWLEKHNFESIVAFMDDEWWTKNFQIFLYEEVYYDQLTDEEILQDMIDTEKNTCLTSTFEINKFVCDNFKIISKQKKSSSIPTYEITGSYTKKFVDDKIPIKIIFTITDIVDRNDVWEIVSEVIIDDMNQLEIQNNLSVMSNMLSTFNLNIKSQEFNSLIDLPTLEYYYYVETIPNWTDDNFYQTAVKDAINKVSKKNPWLTFRETSYEDSEIRISWIKEYADEKLGQTHSSIGEVAIGMGDSFCNSWKPYNYEMLVDVIAHELLHGVGFMHSSDPQSIMYPVLNDSVYQNEIYELHLRDWEYQAFPLCTIKTITDYNVKINPINTYDKFNVFLVKSENDLKKYDEGKMFDNYSYCSADSTNNFNKECVNVSQNSWVIVGTEDISKDWFDGTVELQETRYDGNLDYSVEKIPGIEDVLRANANFEADRLNYNKAIIIYEKIIESNPSDTFALNNLGTVYQELGDTVKAVEYYEKTLRLNPIDEFALGNIGSVLKEQGKYKEALVYFDKVLEINPNSVFALQQEREIKLLLDESSKGGGCLIATAAFGSEMAPQVQQLRELRDNFLLHTASGSAFMSGFNQFYYSFSPTIADFERENPVFKEMVKIAITPMLSTLSIMTLADDSESGVLGFGISVILLNLGIYVVGPAFIIHKIQRKL